MVQHSTVKDVIIDIVAKLARPEGVSGADVYREFRKTPAGRQPTVNGAKRDSGYVLAHLSGQVNTGYLVREKRGAVSYYRAAEKAESRKPLSGAIVDAISSLESAGRSEITVLDIVDAIPAKYNTTKARISSSLPNLINKGKVERGPKTARGNNAVRTYRLALPPEPTAQPEPVETDETDDEVILRALNRKLFAIDNESERLSAQLQEIGDRIGELAKQGKAIRNVCELLGLAHPPSQ